MLPSHLAEPSARLRPDQSNMASSACSAGPGSNIASRRRSPAWAVPLRSCMPSMRSPQSRRHTPSIRAAASSAVDEKPVSSHTTGRSTRPPAKQVVEEFYRCYNAGDVQGVMATMADDCVYHDMIYLFPHEGRKEVRSFFEMVAKTLPRDLKFAVDAISDGDPHYAGVKWHVDLNGNEFPFSRGCSFYEVNDEGKIVAARDCVEPATKPGDLAIKLIAVLTPLMRRLGPRANPRNLKEVPLSAIALWAFYIGYMAFIFFSASLPGQPAYAVEQSTLKEVLNNSINFFYVNPILNWLGLGFIPSTAEHPVGEALFNLVNAWTLMFLPVMLADGKGARVKGTFRWWLGAQFLTNVFLIPWLCLREQPPGSRGTRASPPRPAMPRWAPAVGAVAGAVGLASLPWALAVRPEFGGLAERWQYFAAQAAGNRVFFAFLLDAVLYSVWQALLMDRQAPAWQRYTPFFGLAAYLLTAQQDDKQDALN